MKALWDKVMSDKAKFALVVIAGILALQFIGVLVIAGISVNKFGESRVPTEMWDLIRTTVTLLVGVAGSMYLNGRTKKSEESNGAAAEVTSKRSDRLHL